MLKVIKNEEMHSAPFITCDHCGELIRKAGLALAMWHSKGGVMTEDGKVYVVHKDCHIEFENGDPVSWKSTELNQYLRRLIYNMQADITEDRVTEMLDNQP